MQAVNVLRASRGVIDSCKQELKDFEPVGTQCDSREAVRALRKYSAQACAFQQRIRTVNQMLQSTSELVFHFLAPRPHFCADDRATAS